MGQPHHVSTDGNIRPCKAQSRVCPIATEELHFQSKEEAYAATPMIEAYLAGQLGNAMASMKKQNAEDLSKYRESLGQDLGRAVEHQATTGYAQEQRDQAVVNKIGDAGEATGRTAGGIGLAAGVIANPLVAGIALGMDNGRGIDSAIDGGGKMGRAAFSFIPSKIAKLRDNSRDRKVLDTIVADMRSRGEGERKIAKTRKQMAGALKSIPANTDELSEAQLEQVKTWMPKESYEILRRAAIRRTAYERSEKLFSSPLGTPIKPRTA